MLPLSYRRAIPKADTVNPKLVGVRRVANAEHKSNLFYAAAGSLLARYIRLVYRTSRQTEEMTERFERHAHHHPCIVTMWHGQFMLLPLVKRPDFETDVMLARHRDAELMGAVLREFGIKLIRGAGAAKRGKDKGGSHAYRAAVQTLREGRTVALTADVPGGEPRHAGLGVVMIARQTGRPILPMAIATSRYISFNTWSRMTLNLPWSDLGFAIGEPVHVPRTAEGEDLEKYRLAVDASLNAATALAYRRAGADAKRATPNVRLQGPAEPGFRLKAYRALTSLARPVTPLLLSMRERNGKEDPARRLERLGRPSLPRPTGTLAWFHAASVGETNAILPLMAELAKQRPTLSFLLTTGTVTSAKLAAERLGPRAIHQYAPLDAPEYVRGFLDHWRPDLAVLTESEIWPNLILESSARRIPLALVNGRMTKRSFRRWRRSLGVARPLFSRFSLVLTQNEKLARRFRALGAGDAFAAGNLKIDTPPPPIDLAELERLKPVLGGRSLLIAASTHEGEDAIVAEAHCRLRQTIPDLCTIIAPRHPERGSAVTDLLKSKGLSAVRRSLGEVPDRTSDAYVADTIGELGMLYTLAPVAFIGGSLVDRGGQNPIEAVRQGAAVLTGPHCQNFADAYDALISHQAAIVVRSAPELAAAAGQLLVDGAERSRMHARASTALAALSGALPRTVDALLHYLPVDNGLARAS
jgi:3-deoxy-D-manno-octulosonic-acid transferase